MLIGMIFLLVIAFLPFEWLASLNALLKRIAL
jgi:hypothetical protein